MAVAIVDGIPTRYEITGSGAPVLLCSPGGFNATLDNWEQLGVYKRLQLRPHLAEHMQCIAFDRRESGQSGGRLERLSWQDYADQALGVLDGLGIERAHLIGGCVGCSVALCVAIAHPERVASLILFSPAGGPRYRMAQHARFRQHLAFVADNGLRAVVARARESAASFSEDPCVGPWATVLRRDETFAERYGAHDPGRYATMVSAMARLLFDRDTVPGVEPEDLMGLDVPAFIVPGHDASHAPSAARYLEECLPNVEYWDIAVEDQREENVRERLLRFLLSTA
jgi:pimeloyl-ACP methyl ester carboxylesterase